MKCVTFSENSVRIYNSNIANFANHYLENLSKQQHTMAHKNKKDISNAISQNGSEKTAKDSKSEDFKITGKWAAQSEILQEKFAQLTDADLEFEVGEEENLLQKIEKRLKKKRDEVINIIRKSA